MLVPIIIIFRIETFKVPLTSGCFQDELIESKAFSAGFGDSGASGFSEVESSDSELWHFEESLIISDSSNNNNSAVSKRDIRFQRYLLALSELLDNSRD